MKTWLKTLLCYKFELRDQIVHYQKFIISRTKPRDSKQRSKCNVEDDHTHSMHQPRTQALKTSSSESGSFFSNLKLSMTDRPLLSFPAH